jgi:adenosylhomocysteinase
LPINFILQDATPIKHIDPILYAHNLAAVELVTNPSYQGFRNLAEDIDQEIITQWCQFHQKSPQELARWLF